MEAVAVTEAGIDRIQLALGELALIRDDFVIFGSGPMLAHGIREDIADLDIVARGKAWKRARELGGAEMDLVRVTKGGIEIEIGSEWYSPLLWAADELIDSESVTVVFRDLRDSIRDG